MITSSFLGWGIGKNVYMQSIYFSWNVCMKSNYFSIAQYFRISSMSKICVCVCIMRDSVWQKFQNSPHRPDRRLNDVVLRKFSDLEFEKCVVFNCRLRISSFSMFEKKKKKRSVILINWLDRNDIAQNNCFLKFADDMKTFVAGLAINSHPTPPKQYNHIETYSYC